MEIDLKYCNSFSNIKPRIIDLSNKIYLLKLRIGSKLFNYAKEVSVYK